MPHRRKILIIENDDFLREILGNILHKKGLFILNGETVAEGLQDVERSGGNAVDQVILGTSCTDYEEKKTLKFIKSKLNDPKIFVINDSLTPIAQISPDHQIMVKDLSIKNIITNMMQEGILS